jgi:hypothetical protein
LALTLIALAFAIDAIASLMTFADDEAEDSADNANEPIAYLVAPHDATLDESIEAEPEDVNAAVAETPLEATIVEAPE